MTERRIAVSWHECRQADVPADDSWLSETELRTWRAFRIPKRRDDWRLGRWTAKHAVAAYLQMPVDPRALAAVEIRPADSGAPGVFLHHAPAPLAISLSHANGVAVCTVTAAGVAVGCDLESIEPRSETFIADYFVEQERALLSRSPADERPWLGTLIWSAKESALKALGEGLRLDTRSVKVRMDGAWAVGGWHPLTVAHEGGRTFAGWWRRDQHLVRTLVSDPASNAPAVKIAEFSVR